MCVYVCMIKSDFAFPYSVVTCQDSKTKIGLFPPKVYLAIWLYLLFWSQFVVHHHCHHLKKEKARSLGQGVVKATASYGQR